MRERGEYHSTVARRDEDEEMDTVASSHSASESRFDYEHVDWVRTRTKRPFIPSYRNSSRAFEPTRSYARSKGYGEDVFERATRSELRTSLSYVSPRVARNYASGLRCL